MPEKYLNENKVNLQIDVILVPTVMALRLILKK